MEVERFEWDARSPRVVFGLGRARELGAELARLSAARTLCVGTATGMRRYAPRIESITSVVGQFAGAQPHCPEEVAGAALEQFRVLACDSVVAIGGGSTLGLGKFIAAQTGCTWVALPTTMSGSEMTALFGIKTGGEKRTRTDETARPKTVIYDAEIASELPVHETVTTSMNCLAHCIEAFYVQRTHSLARSVAELGVREIATCLPVLADQPRDLEARQRLLQAGMIGGWLVSLVGIALHHKICHVIGGHYDIAHADTNSAVLPHVAAYYENCFAAHRAALAASLGSASVGAGIFELARRCRAPQSLEELGVKSSSLDAIADEALRSTTWSPIPVGPQDVRRLLQAAFEGRKPD
jgi:maleylacetate reductase